MWDCELWGLRGHKGDITGHGERITGKVKSQLQADNLQPEGEQLYVENTEFSSELINDFFYEVILSYEKALYAGLEFQEELLKIVAHLVEKTGSPLPLRKELETLSTQVFPKARNRLDQVLEVGSLRIMLLNRASSQITGLAARAATLWNSSSLSEAWNEFDDLSQKCLKILAADTSIFLNTNSKILQICKELANPHPFVAAFSEQTLPPIPKTGGLSRIFRTVRGHHSKKQEPQPIRPKPARPVASHASHASHATNLAIRSKPKLAAPRN